MKRWGYRNEEEKEENNSNIPNIIITSANEEQTVVNSGIRVINNKILFYADIDEGSILELNRVLLELDCKLQSP